MAKKFIDQDLFDYVVCFVAMISMVSKHSESELFDMCWKSYEHALIDDNVKQDVLTAVKLAKQNLIEWDAPSHPAFFKHFQNHIEQFNPDGTRKGVLKKVFHGLAFAKSVQNPNRVQDFIKRMTVFYAGLIAGAYST